MKLQFFSRASVLQKKDTQWNMGKSIEAAETDLIKKSDIKESVINTNFLFYFFIALQEIG